MAISTTWMGGIASRELRRASQASVLGVTSRGCFLQTVPRRVIFLSLESWRGPLTLNLSAEYNVLSMLESGLPARIATDCVYFPTVAERIYLDRAEVWHAPPLPPAPLLPEQRRERLCSVVDEGRSVGKVSMLHELPSNLLDCEGQETSQLLVGLREALLERRISAILAAAEPVLGLGAGLTPSGDDLVTGLMLALNRWGQVLAPGLDLGTLNQEIARLAYEKTTLLSANLIDCACQGGADERLILGLDGIISGAYDLTSCASSLAGWGNTSGMDALAGMALALIGSPA